MKAAGGFHFSYLGLVNTCHVPPHEAQHTGECMAEIRYRYYGGIPHISYILGKYRIIEWFSSGGNFSRLRTARIEGYLAGNRDSCRQQAAEIHPLMGREHCAVFP